MKPITNILLVLAIICYVFLPFYHISFQGTITGFSFTASTITQQPTLRHITFALLPFIACFFAIGFNTLKNRWWGLASVAFILLGLYFFNVTHDVQAIALRHAPDVVPSDGMGEGFEVKSVAVGYIASCTLMVLSLISAILSVLPFDFNFTLERAVDQTIDRGIDDVKAFGTRMSGEVKGWQEKRHHHSKAAPERDTAPPQSPGEPPAGDAPAPDPEDPSRFMPKEE